MFKRSLNPILLATMAAGSALGVSACIAVFGNEIHGPYDEDGQEVVAEGKVVSKSGSSLHGWVSFTEEPGGALVWLEVEDAPPGWHAVHVHEVGDCSSEDGKSAGGHFNPMGVAHGAPHAAVHHAGDLGNMFVDEDGNGLHVLFAPGLTVAEGDHSVVGRAIIIHAGADDLVSQPTGAAGGRIGCGEIE